MSSSKATQVPKLARSNSATKAKIDTGLSRQKAEKNVTPQNPPKLSSRTFQKVYRTESREHTETNSTLENEQPLNSFKSFTLGPGSSLNSHPDSLSSAPRVKFAEDNPPEPREQVKEDINMTRYPTPPLIDNKLISSSPLSMLNGLIQPMQTIQNTLNMSTIQTPPVRYTSSTEHVTLPSFRKLGFENNPRMSEMVDYLENKFSKLEQRLETNDNLFKLFDEMKSLTLLERQNSLDQRKTTLGECYRRLNSLEVRLKIIEEAITAERRELELRLMDFENKVDNYFLKFVESATHIGDSIEKFIEKEKREDQQSEAELAEINKKTDTMVSEIREKFMTIGDAVDTVGKVVDQTNTVLIDEKTTVVRLEDDFLKLLDAYREFNQNRNDLKFVTDEVALMKYRQGQLLAFLNVHFGFESGEGQEGSTDQ